MALPKSLKYIRVVLHTFVGLILFILLIIPTLLYSAILRVSGPKHVPLHSHFFIRIVYLAAAMFPYQWYHPALAIRTLLVPGERSMIVKRDTWTAYWVGTLETRKIPSETRGGDPTWRVSLKGVDVIMLYAHGGGFVFGDAEMYNNIFCSWVNHFKTVHNKTLRILSVDYAGDSSGANVLLNACVVLRENRLPPPRALLCISPWLRLDADLDTSPSMARNRKTDFMPPQVFKKIARSYAGSKGIHDPHISPFYVQDHTKFPELAMIYSGGEVLRDDCARFVDHFQATGGKITYHYMAEGMPHVYPLLRELAGKTAVKDAERRLMEWINLLVEENRVLFENRRKVNATRAAATAAAVAADRAENIGPLAPLATSEFSQTPLISHATRIVAAVPTIHSTKSDSSPSGSSTPPTELQEVVTEKPGAHTSSNPKPVFLGGDKEEYFDEVHQDDSDDEGDNDDVSLEMIILENN
ncbi:hypothetical protein BGW38_005142 [Lunasporangiospora selenospora]|uniref:Alpha/beta hydrolase fold-3 domain-containing protein n=1 Tax=Lunasporangiospora selenospora TaxID=979761 RepID=A0A9P6KBJ9_9FUNG|nr:hypothetical protein BGW38_005142 [Lunasporangiospora selenospora]